MTLPTLYQCDLSKKFTYCFVYPFFETIEFQGRTKSGSSVRKRPTKITRIR